ncbi:MAG: imidazolonepropionase [Acholeplasmatales bacterium]|nr:MAG: imidazolonepropionase [Acholeplasmatales bacterium]
MSTDPCATTLIQRIGTLMTPIGPGPKHGAKMQTVHTIKRAFIAILDGRILAVGEGLGDAYIGAETTVVDAEGKLALPGFIDSHTHLVHAGSREHEFAQKQAGVPYMDILKAGGGIHSTVKATQDASFETLYAQAANSLAKMVQYGVTTVEAKSGYGLTWETEKKQLEVAQALDDTLPVRIISTFMGAHAVPKNHPGGAAKHVEQLVALLPKVKANHLASFVDVFCEKGVYGVAEARTMLEAAKKHGFKLKIHADEIVALGGVPLAVELKAHSADHLMAIDAAGIKALSQSSTVATLLPGTSFYLGHAYAPARTLLKEGVAIALASDYNPGSCPSENFGFTLNLAALKLNMTPEEILTAATLNAAHALDLGKTIGSLEVGKQADIILCEAPNFVYMLYHFATNHVRDVFIAGKPVVRDGSLNYV